MVICILLLTFGYGKPLYDQSYDLFTRAQQAQAQGSEAVADRLFTEAQQKLNKLIEKQPDHKRAWLLKAKAHFYLGQDVHAADAFDKLCQMDPNNHEAFFYRGMAQIYGGSHQEAVASFTRATQLEPANPVYFEELGRANNFIGEYEQALKAYDQALRLSPDSESAMFQTGVALSRLGRPRMALERFSGLLLLYPKNQNALYNAGQLHQILGEHGAALNRFDKLVKLAPKDGTTLSKMVQIHDELGNNRRREQYRRKIYRLWRRGEDPKLVKLGFFVATQFDEGDRHIVGLENFELKGEEAKKYVFRVYAEDMREIVQEISLGSYALLNSIAQESGQIKGDDRLYHLDSTWPDGRRQTYETFYGKEPDYDEVKQLVIRVLRGEHRAFAGRTQ
ncbi:tetratricopeptide repeat protein [Acanthopleuribacter pedis]|uniref:Tetratricopeptide repeat protein n=1 Tax=Acanthopleuribacter pedis TaxID=442870 RepID=A0A8J7QBK7_9BACT|nr:tetratricopeptide repeat protein [Acanthopleuribacter pedis]MBO1320689.1 tetratricopeptide repeat protein [Acanthopleuribacter pedis]